MQPKSNDWRLEQARTIGGSSAAAVINEHPYMTPLDLHLRIVDAHKGIAPQDISDQPDIKRGLMLEPIALQLFEDRVGVAVQAHDQDRFEYNKEFEWAHCLPDAWWLGEPVEIKVPRPAGWRRAALEGINPYWVIQCQHTMAVTATDHCHLVLLNPVTMDLLHIVVDRDEGEINDMMLVESIFWNNSRKGIAPDPPEQPKVDIPDTPASVLESDDAARVALHFIHCQDMAEEAAAVVEIAKGQLLEMADGRDAFEIPGLLRVYNRLQEGRRTFNRQKAMMLHPELAQEEFWSQGRPFRTFRTYRLGDL